MSSCITGCRTLNASSSEAFAIGANSFSARSTSATRQASRMAISRFSTVASSAACICRSVFFEAPPYFWICCVLRYSTLRIGSGWRSRGKQFGHLQGRQHGHRRMEADVVLAAKGLGVGQGAGGDEALQVGLAAVELFDEDRLELFGRACFAAGRPRRRTCRTTANRRLRRQRPCGSPMPESDGPSPATSIPQPTDSKKLRRVVAAMGSLRFV